MNTAYNTNTTPVQDARNRYNALLAQALERIKARKTDKTAQQPEEVTTTATDVTTTPTQQPEPVATPEEVTTEYYGYLDGRDPMQIGRIKKQLDRRIYVDDKTCTWAEYIAEGYEAGQLKAYKDEYTYDKKGRDLAYHEHKVTEWVIWTAREMERGNGVLANKTIVDYALYLIKLMEEAAPVTAPQATEEDTTTAPEATAETPVQEPEEVTTEEVTPAPATDDATLLRNLIDQYGNVGADYLDTLDYTQATKQEQRNVLFGRAKVTKKYYTTDKPDPAGYPQTYGLSRYYNRSGKRAVFIVYKDGLMIEQRLYEENNKTYITGVRLDGGKLLYKVTGGLVTRAELTRDGNTISVFFDDTNRPATPRDLPAPAPSKPTSKETTKEEPATTVQEQATNKETPTPEATTVPETDDATLLRDVIEQYGNMGADYLDTLDYSQATKQEPRIVIYEREELTEKRYTIGTPDMFGILQTYGLARRYDRNGERAMFIVYKGDKIIEVRTYDKNNTYEAELRCGEYDDLTVRYQVEDGKVIRAERIRFGRTIETKIATFNDNNRPATPRDLPEPVATPEATTVPEEVKEVTTSKQEDDTTPYWLLLDNELRAQQEEQEQALATPEATKQEEPAPATEATDDPEEVVFLKGAELDKVIAEYSERNNLDIEYQNKRYYFYATADGYIVKLDKNKPKSRLYIADEGPYYDSYRKGEITDRDIFFEQNMNILGDYSRQRLESPVNCNVRRTITGDLSIDPFGKIEYSYDPATGKSEEIPVKHPTTRELAIYVAARKAYEADQRERLEKYWKRYSDKVWVDTYWANR